MELSVCLIVKDEESNIKQAVTCARKIADEIIVVDTGSTDNTLKILEEIGQAYYRHEWNDSFAEARNISLSYATKDMIFWMDADDNITDDCAMRINTIKEKNAYGAYLFNIDLVNTEMNQTIGGQKRFLQLRMFPNNRGLKFSGRVHEQIIGDAMPDIPRFFAEDITIEHHGYSDKAHQLKSLRRNIRLLMIEHGFPSGRDFFNFDFGPDLYCIYCPNSLAIWYKLTRIGVINPFDTGDPGTHESRLAQMVEKVREFVRSFIPKAKETVAHFTDIDIIDLDLAVCGEPNVCDIA